MVSITVYGGADEIGGNKILVRSDGTGLMLDFGRRMGFDSRFFSEFINPRTNTEIRDRLVIGSLPLIPGIYRTDMLRPQGVNDLPEDDRIISPDSHLLDFKGLKTYEEYYDENARGYVDAVLLTHAHLDHTGDLQFVHPDIPLCCSPVTELLVNAIDEVTTFKSYALEMRRPEIAYNQRGMFPGAPKIKKTDHSSRNCINGNNRIGSIDVKTIDVDHSVPGACSFLLNTDEKRILYTGDIRFHGTSPVSLEEYVGNIGEGLDVMICEGTRVDSECVITENMVRESITEDISRTRGIVFVDFSWKDTTRYETVRSAAKENNRTFVINGRLAYLLNKMNMYPEDGTVKVFLKRTGSALYSPSDYTKSKHELGFSVDKEDIDTSHYENGLTALEIMEEPEKYVLMFSYFDFNQLFDFTNTQGKIPGSLFIKAQCEPFSDDMELDEERMINWLEQFGIGFDEGDPDINPDCTDHRCPKIKRCISRAHVSGHASRPELKELIAKLKPDVLIPVHTLFPEEFKKIASEIREEKGHSTEVIIPELGVEYEF